MIFRWHNAETQSHSIIRVFYSSIKLCYVCLAGSFSLVDANAKIRHWAVADEVKFKEIFSLKNSKNSGECKFMHG